MTDFPRLLTCLTDGNVEFIVIGGFAAAAHGSAHLTVDLDIVHRRTPENVLRLVRALLRARIGERFRGSAFSFVLPFSLSPVVF